VTGKERMATVMRLGVPDRIPVMCQLALGHYFLNCGIPEIEIWHSTAAFGEALIQLQRRYRFDGILVNLPGRDPSWRSQVNRVEARASDRVIHWSSGYRTVCPPDDNPHVYRPDWTPVSVRFEEVDPARLFYVEPHDLSGADYPFSWGFSGVAAARDSFFPSWQFDTIEYVVSRTGNSVSVHGEIFSPFSQLLELIGYTGALLALADDPGKFEACLDALSEGAVALGCGLAAHGVDAILISSAFAGAGFLSREHYRRFVLPYEKKVIDGIRAAHDIPIYTHTCGSIGDRLELMEETGTGGIDTLDPPPLGNVELRDAKLRVGERLFIKGNLDPVHVLLEGNPATVRAAAERCIDAAAPGGGYILSSACSVPPHTPPENLEALVAVAESRR
jgi:hypothetical protein